jgi:hypothetical protein
MLSQDAEAFERVMQDLCLAFNRPYTPELSRVFWESLRNVSIFEVKRAADAARKSLKKFPAPKDLIPDRPAAPPPKPVTDDEQWSPWAIAANKILFAVAYEDVNRGFRPMGDALPKCLAAKADYVRMAEDSAVNGDVWNHEEFNRMCREGFQQILGA